LENPVKETLDLRDAVAADAAAIADIFNESILAATATMVVTPQTAADIRRQMAGFTNREGYVVLERAGEVIGWGAFKLYSPRGGYNRCAETSVFLRRTESGRGLGSRVVQALIERCREAGYRHLIARVWADNEASRALFRKMGFEVVGIQRDIGYIGGHWQDIAILQLVLEDVGPEVAERFF